MDLLNRFVNRIDFDSYEDFKQNFKINVPEDFNFGFDVVDVYAKEVPDQEALIWCDDDGEMILSIPKPADNSGSQNDDEDYSYDQPEAG